MVTVQRIMLVLALFWMSSPLVALAAVPQLVHYQGRLSLANGDPVTDGSYSLTFRIYGVSEGGAPLWEETQAVDVTGGMFAAYLGAVTALALPFNADYWLAVEVETDGEMTPRVQLASVGTAIRARYAEQADAGFVVGSGALGIGTAFPSANLHVVEPATASPAIKLTSGGYTAAIGVAHESGTHFFSSAQAGDLALQAHQGARIRLGADNGSGSGEAAVTIGADGSVGVGTASPGAKLEVAGQVKIAGGSPGAGKVLTSDAAGLGSWQTPSPGANPAYGGSASAPADEIYVDGSGNVGIGRTPSLAKVSIAGSIGIASPHLFALIDGYVAGSPQLKLYPEANTNGAAYAIQASRAGLAADAPLALNPYGGKIGMGTSSPGEKLEITGNLKFTAAASIATGDGDLTAAPAAGLTLSTSGAGAIHRIAQEANASSDFLFLQGQRTGKGVVALLAPRDLDGSDWVQLTLRNRGALSSSTADSEDFTPAHWDVASGVWGTTVSQGGSGVLRPWRFSMGGTEALRVATNGDLSVGSGDLFVEVATGEVGIGTITPAGKLDVNGSIYQRGAQLHADYVFADSYELESIEEHARYMWQNKHLTAMPPRRLGDDGQEIVEIGAHQKGIVEELEKAHLYIEQLHKTLQEQQAEIAAIKSQLSRAGCGAR
ncbi:MAG: hypothetical protein HYV63_08130 [Candidatus Schekmanbacteria bacterium]|nr:hypothetical protein [Candidatus Schekmanbacteria bacterium]